MHLGGVLKNFGGVLKPSRCVLESLEGVWRAPRQAQASSEKGLERFFARFWGVFSGSEAEIKN